MRIDKFYDVQLLHTVPHLMILAFLSLGIAKTPAFLTPDAIAAGSSNYIYDDNGAVTDIKEYENNLKKTVGVLTEEKTNSIVETKNKHKTKVDSKDNDFNAANEKKDTKTEQKTNSQESKAKSNPAAGTGSKTKLTVNIVNKNEIDIAGRKIQIFKSTNTLTDSGNMVAEYGDKFLYGHNTAGVFRNLHNMRAGETFSVTRNGKTEKFVVAKTELLTKARTADFMVAIVNARYYGQQYALSLMTCAGEPRPNMDATHRFLVFAKKIA